MTIKQIKLNSPSIQIIYLFLFLFICIIPRDNYAEIKLAAGVNSTHLKEIPFSSGYSAVFGLTKEFKLAKSVNVNGEFYFSRKVGSIQDVIIRTGYMDEHYYYGNINCSIPLIEAIASLQLQPKIKNDLYLIINGGYGWYFSLDGLENSNTRHKYEIDKNSINSKIYSESMDPPWYTRNAGKLFVGTIGIGGINRFSFLLRYKEYTNNQIWIGTVLVEDEMFSIEYLVSIRL